MVGILEGRKIQVQGLTDVAMYFDEDCLSASLNDTDSFGQTFVADAQGSACVR